MSIIAIDFDKTISADYPAAKKAITTLRAAGHFVIIWSCRNNKFHLGKEQARLYAEMLKALQDNEIPYDNIDNGQSGKFYAQVYIDDKAWRFENNWDEIIEKIY